MNTTVILLIVHGLFFNLIILPLAILFPSIFSSLYSADKFHFQDWVNSVCINLLTWHLLYIIYKRPKNLKAPRRFRDYLKKFTWIGHFEQLLYKKIKPIPKKTNILLLLVIVAITINIIVPLILSTLLGYKLAYRSLGLTFISIQFICFIAFYGYSRFPDEMLDNEDPIPSPWLLEIIFCQLKKKSIEKNNREQ